MHRFSFNLLPEKPKEVIVQEEGRESTSLVLAILPFVSVLVSIILIIINNVIIQRNINTWTEANTKKDNEIRGYESVIKLNIEFASKTELLQEPVTKDVEPEQFFDLSDEVLNTLPFSLSIEKYGRNADGSFDITLRSGDIRNSGDMLRAFELNDKISYANMKSINYDPDTDVIDTTISFFIQDQEVAL